MADELELEKVLGLNWDSRKDAFRFSVKINLNPLKKKERTGPPLTKQMLLEAPPGRLTRRQYYSQVQALFDPTGFLTPILLRGKLLLRRTWEEPCDELGWDDDLPLALKEDIFKFFLELYELEDLEFPRSLWPKEAVVGDPWLISFSDGSQLGYGGVVYI